MNKKINYLNLIATGLICVSCNNHTGFWIKRDKLYFGEYKKPELLLKLEDYQSKEEIFWEYLGFYIAYDAHNSATPLDAIPFAKTGGDGIHFAFLTDFGRNNDLTNSPIICVSPTNDPPVRLIARNLTDFLKLVATVGEAEFLDEDYSSDKEIQTRLANWDRVDTVDYMGNPVPKEEIKYQQKRSAENKANRVEIRQTLKEKFNIDTVSSVVEYISNFRGDRRNSLNIQTIDSLGILVENVDPIKSFDYSRNSAPIIRAYLESANKSERLKLYRESTYHYIISQDYDNEIRKLLIEWLEKDGFKRESKILEKVY